MSSNTKWGSPVEGKYDLNEYQDMFDDYEEEQVDENYVDVLYLQEPYELVPRTGEWGYDCVITRECANYRRFNSNTSSLFDTGVELSKSDELPF
jgi:hypothetical protein